MRVLAVVVLVACGSTEPAPVTPVTPAAIDDGSIPAEPQRTGDAKKGWEALVGEGYVGCGVPRSLWDSFGGKTPPAWKLDRTRGADLPYFMNTMTMPSGVEVVTANCLGCHAAWLRGKLVIGLGEASADFTFDVSNELTVASLLLGERERAEASRLVGRMRALAGAKTRTVGANPADHVAALLFAHRDPATLAWSDEPKLPISDEPPIPVDVPAWWLLKRKTAMFHTAAGRGDHARIMMTASVMCVDDVATARAVDAYFPDIRAYILGLEPPAFPGPIDRALAARGQPVFERTCAKCHGTYAGKTSTYRSRVVPLAKVGTDPVLAEHAGQFAAPFVQWFNSSFYGERARLAPGNGYVPPPLDGVWATAPYLHNGSVPNLAALLDSGQRRPKTRIERGGEAYDLTAVGWPNRAADASTPTKLVYDTSIAGYANTGHTFGDKLSADDRAAVIEYLKTL